MIKCDICGTGGEHDHRGPFRYYLDDIICDVCLLWARQFILLDEGRKEIK